jgi:hypothetical protein
MPEQPDYATPREEREGKVREGDVDWFLSNAASFKEDSLATVALCLVMREVRDELHALVDALELERQERANAA